MKTTFKDGREIQVYLAILWAVCVLVSFVGFYIRWQEIPNIVDSVVNSHLLLLFAIPKSFGDVLHISDITSTRLTLPLVALYWPTTGFICFRMFKLRSVRLFCLIAVVSLTSAYHWLTVSSAMMGI